MGHPVDDEVMSLCRLGADFVRICYQSFSQIRFVGCVFFNCALQVTCFEVSRHRVHGTATTRPTDRS